MDSSRKPHPQHLRPARTPRVTRTAGLRRPTTDRKRRGRPSGSWNWTAIASVIAALAAAAGVYYTGQSLDATRRQNTVAEQGQATDRLAQAAERLTHAVDQLDRSGADHLQARLGAIYALERLAHDSPPDHPTIVEVLTAFIRTTTPQPAPATTAAKDNTCNEQTTIGADIQAALTVLGRRNANYDQNDMNLRNACLRHAELPGANFSDADLLGANFSDANLSRANLRTAYLTGASFDGASLVEASLSEAHLERATLVGAFLRQSNFDRAILDRANLSDASLLLADLVAADLSGAILDRTKLHNADFRDAQFYGTNLRSLDLSGSDLRGAILDGAILDGADLSAVDLRGAQHDLFTSVNDVVTNELTKGKWW